MCIIDITCIFYSVLSVYKVLDVLLSKNKIDLNMAERVRGFLNGTTPDSSLLTTPITTKINRKVINILVIMYYINYLRD